MNREEKLLVLKECKEKNLLCRCFYKYDSDYFYYYINEFNDRFMLGQEEDDFILNGYAIRKISDLTKNEFKVIFVIE